MTRPFVRYTLFVKGPNSEAIVTQNAQVIVKREGTLDDPTMWDEPVGGNPVANPLITDIQGEVEAYLDVAEVSLVDLYVNDNGGLTYRAGQPGRPIGFPAFVEEDVQLVTIGGVGSTGPQGPQGPKGDKGDPGTGGGADTTIGPAIRFDHVSPTIWYVGHNPDLNALDSDTGYTIRRYTWALGEAEGRQSATGVSWQDRTTAGYT